MLRANDSRMAGIKRAAVAAVREASGAVAVSAADADAGIAMSGGQSIVHPAGSLYIMCGVSKCGGTDVCGLEVSR